MSLLKEIEYEAAAKTKKVYEYYLKRLILDPTKASHPVLFNILYKKKLPLRSTHFQWIATTRNLSVEVVRILFLKKIEVDKYVQQ